MRPALIIYFLPLVLSLTQAERKAKIQGSDVTKLEVVDLGEAGVEADARQSDVQRKRDSGYSYSRPNHVFPSPRFRFQENRSRGQLLSKIPGQLGRPFTTYGPPHHSASGTSAHHAQWHRDKWQQHAGQQQQSVGLDGELTQQEVPSLIRDADFTEASPIASQNNEPFGMNTAVYLPPQNQKLPAYATAAAGGFAREQTHGVNSQSQSFAQLPDRHQISDGALFLSANAQAIQQLYGAPASDQDFAPSYDQVQESGDQIQDPNGQFRNLGNAAPSSQEFRGTLPSYASGTLDPRDTLEQIQSLEKDRLIAQLQRALAQTRTTPSAVTPAKYAQSQASFDQKLLDSISQQIKTHASTTPQSTAFGIGSAAFGRSSFLPEGTTVDSLRLRLNYGVPTTAQTPFTTTTATVTEGVSAPFQPPQTTESGGAAQATSSLPAPNQSGSSTIASPVGIPIYGGFVPTFVAGTNFIPSYSTSVFASGPVRPVQPTLSSPTHFGLPIPTESPQKPALGSPSLVPGATTTATTTTPTSVASPGRPGVALTPISPVALPIQPIRPVVTPVHPVVAPVHPVVSAGPAQIHPVQTAPGTHPAYGVQSTLFGSVLYKPIKAIYPVYYDPNVAYQLQKPVLPSYPWSYAPSHAQTKPAPIWK